eukprot:3744176-Amphidinium_carterae.3
MLTNAMGAHRDPSERLEYFQDEFIGLPQRMTKYQSKKRADTRMTKYQSKAEGRHCNRGGGCHAYTWRQHSGLKHQLWARGDPHSKLL